MRRPKTFQPVLRLYVFLILVTVIIGGLIIGCGSNIPVQSSSAIIAVTPASLDFTAPFGLSSSQDSIIVTNAGSDSLLFQAVAGASWIRIEGQTENRVFVRANSLGLPIGTVTASITISSSQASNSPLNIPVTFTVLNRFLLSDTVLTFSGLTGGANPSPATVALSSGGGVAEDYTLSWKASWLSVSPVVGTTPQQITLVPTVAGLPGGLLVDTVIFRSSNTPELSKVLEVKLSLSSWTVGIVPVAVDVQGLDFVDVNNGWAAGFLGGGSGTNGVVLGSTDGGLSWPSLTIIGGGGLGDIAFTDNLNGVTVGDSARIFRTVDGGLTWNQLPRQNLPVDSSADFWRVTFVNDSVGFIIGTQGTILRTLDGGVNWSKQVSNTIFSLGGMSFSSANVGWIVGNAGTILHTNNSGASWQIQTAGSSIDLWGVAFVDASSGWIVGSIGKMLSTIDGGITWENVQSPVSVLLRNVSFVGSNLGWAVGQSGTVVHTSDGGASWIVQSTGTSSQLFGLFFFDQNVGVVTGFGGTILKTLNGGF